MILQAFLTKLEERKNTNLFEDINRNMKLVSHDRRGFYLNVEEVPEYRAPR